MNEKHVNKPVLCNGLGICTEGTCGNDVVRQGDRARRETVEWSTMHGQIWTVDRAEIDGRERRTGGQLVRWVEVKQCTGSMIERRWMRAPRSNSRGEFRSLAFVQEIMREMGGF